MSMEPVKYRRRIQACYWAAGQAFRMRQLQKKAHFVWKSIKMKHKGGGIKIKACRRFCTLLLYTLNNGFNLRPGMPPRPATGAVHAIAFM